MSGIAVFLLCKCFCWRVRVCAHARVHVREDTGKEPPYGPSTLTPPSHTAHGIRDS